jgi:signal transduction histidine kinase
MPIFLRSRHAKAAVKVPWATEAATHCHTVRDYVSRDLPEVQRAISGRGIDSAHLDRVFDAFYTTKSGGTGMGLLICRSIIHAHGGELWAEANEPRGAVFQFT